MRESVALREEPAGLPIALQRCDVFVGRTMNWLYDHLRFVAGYAPVVLCDRLDNREEFPALEAWVVNAASVTRRAWRRIAHDRIYPRDLWRLRKRFPRVLHSHFGYVAAGDDALQRALEVPWLVGFYGADVYLLGRSAEWKERYAELFERITLALALGPAMAHQLERLGCPAEKIEINPLGVDVQSIPFARRELVPGEPLRVLFAGTFREKKGIQYLVQAVARARRSGVPIELSLVGDAAARPGDAETKAEVFRLIRELGLEEAVSHHSWTPYAKLLGLALRSHVFVAPSVTATDGDAEGTPFVIQQMMATGMPVIATRHSDIPFAFGEHARLLVPERDAAAIADRLLAYAGDPQVLAEDGLALRAHAERALDVRDCALRLSRIYDAVRGVSTRMAVSGEIPERLQSAPGATS